MFLSFLRIGNNPRFPPDTAILTSNTTDPTDGDVITLTCLISTSVPVYEWYEFLLDSLIVAGSPGNTLTLSPAVFGLDDGVYTCGLVFGIPTDIYSERFNLKCEYFEQ